MDSTVAFVKKPPLRQIGALVKKPPMGVAYKRRRFYLGKSYWFKIHNNIILAQDMVLFGKLHKAPNLFLLPIIILVLGIK